MSDLLIKIKNFLRNKWREYQQTIHEKQIRNNTRKLKKAKKTDFQRWRRSEEVLIDWQERTKIITEMIPENSSIIEFGAGKMWMRENLPIGCKYKPSDLVAHTSEIVVCDLNYPIKIDLSEFDTAVFSGVLEYVYDLGSVFAGLQPFIRNIFLTYACKDISPSKRLERGWLSDFSIDDLRRTFKKYNYEEVQCKEWRGQFIFHLVKK
jgi:hypothetical protein